MCWGAVTGGLFSFSRTQAADEPFAHPTPTTLPTHPHWVRSPFITPSPLSPCVQGLPVIWPSGSRQQGSTLSTATASRPRRPGTEAATGHPAGSSSLPSRAGLDAVCTQTTWIPLTWVGGVEGGSPPGAGCFPGWCRRWGQAFRKWGARVIGKDPLSLHGGLPRGAGKAGVTRMDPAPGQRL